jgi:Bacterial Ig-like domain (group 2)
MALHSIQKVRFEKNLAAASLLFSFAMGLSGCAGSLPGASPASTTPAAKTLKSLSISPANPLVTLGSSQQFTVTGSFSDGSQQDLTQKVSWNSTQPTIAAITSTGMAVSKQSGTTLVSAASGTLSSSTKLTVSPAVLVSIAIAPPHPTVSKGTSQQFAAIGKYSDGSAQDLTSTVAWSLSPSGIATVSGAGLASAQAIGTATVTATLGSVAGATALSVSGPALVSIAVAPASSSIGLGATQQLSATGTFSDGTTQDLTGSATWASASPTVAAITSPGVALAQNFGTAVISATSASISGSGTLTVMPAAAVNYFSNANTVGAPDATVNVINPGLTGGNLCAMIYVFDSIQEMNECCGCQISADGERILSVNSDLTSNTLTQVTLHVGLVTIVSADQASNPTCNAGTITPAGMLTSWSTHVQATGLGAFATTEGPSHVTPLTSPELSALQDDCTFIQKLGSGHGICTCGSGD